ncbi:MAG TPA: winged helix-turn-helix domain-containing protein [Streptosporangiaceae bacterium]|nr:winged helix-turn-helix domain-containing protein [Streptosporangiaceae bacterium]
MPPGDGEAETQLLAWSWLSAPPGPQDGRPWDERVPPPDGDATLLAVVPIPGTGTSVAIVGYVIAAPAAAAPAAGRAPRGNAPRGNAPRGKQQAGSGLRLDHLQRRVWVDGDEIQLTFQEFELLAFLAAHPSTVFTRADLVERVWHRNLGPDGRPVPQDSRTVDVHVSRVRRKLGPRYGRYLVTEYRVGYQFRPPPP